MTELQSFSPRVAQVFVDGSASTTMATVTIGGMLGAGKVTRITEADRVVIVERDGLPNVRIYAEGYGVERMAPVVPITAMNGASPALGAGLATKQQPGGKRR